MAGSKRLISFLSIVFFTVLFFSSCRKFDGDQTVPSYISIDSMNIVTDYPLEGSNSNKITTLWIYVDGNIEGIYELPVRAPILARGEHELRIEGGIYLNGIKALRIPYPFYKPVIKNVNLEEAVILDLNAEDFSTTYETTCDFVWMEDFEDPSISLDSLSPSKVNIQRTTPANNPDAFLSPNSMYSGVITLTSEKDYFRLSTNVGSDEGFVLPRGSNPVFLEINYKCDAVFRVGVFAKNYNTVETNPVLNMNPSAEWNKIYVNLKPVVNASVNAINFNIFFEGFGNEGTEPTKIYLDNIKLIHYKVN